LDTTACTIIIRSPVITTSTTIIITRSLVVMTSMIIIRLLIIMATSTIITRLMVTTGTTAIIHSLVTTATTIITISVDSGPVNDLQESKRTIKIFYVTLIRTEGFFEKLAVLLAVVRRD
jgi:hypothetical protein